MIHQSNFRPAAQAPRMRAITTRGGGVILSARTPDGLSLDEIAARAPAVFADDKHDSRSARYEFTDTREVLQGLISEGFRPMEVRQGGSRIVGKAAFTKHAIRLSAPEGMNQIETRPGDRSTAQVVLINSHDGTSAYRLRAGLYRFLCLNGMVVGDDFEDCRVGHVRGAREKVIDAAFRVVQDFPRAIDSVRAMNGLDLTGPEQRAFAAAALQLRWEPEADDQGQRSAPIEPAELIAPRRAADAGDSLWLTMNRAQEGLIRGGQRYVTTTGEGRDRRVTRRTVGAVNSIDQDSKINRALWTLADEMRKIKAAA